MGDYAPNYTARLKFVYSVQGKRHTLVTRWRTSDTIAQATARATVLYDALSNLGTKIYADWQLLSVSWCERNANIFLPVEFSPTDPLGSASTTSRPNNQAAVEVTFPYATSAGGHGYIALFGTSFSVYGTAEQDYRIYSTEDASVANTVTNLNLCPLAGNDAAPVAGFQPYANISLNRRWVRKLRNG